jgi:hypothetical protein
VSSTRPSRPRPGDCRRPRAHGHALSDARRCAPASPVAAAPLPPHPQPSYPPHPLPTPAPRSRAKYRLEHVLRTNLASNDAAYNCVYETEDEEGHRGVRLSKDLMAIAGGWRFEGGGPPASLCAAAGSRGARPLPRPCSWPPHERRLTGHPHQPTALPAAPRPHQPPGEALKANITTLGPLVLPVSEQLLFAGNFVARKFLGFRKLKSYMPDFSLAFDHICIHTGGLPLRRARDKRGAVRIRARPPPAGHRKRRPCPSPSHPPNHTTHPHPPPTQAAAPWWTRSRASSASAATLWSPRARGCTASATLAAAASGGRPMEGCGK